MTLERDAAVVLVDARNVVRSRWPNIHEERFVVLAQAWAAREGVEALLVFDGPAPEGAIGTGDRDADGWIADEAARVAGEGRRVWLVSSDRGLRERVAGYVERTVGGGAFATTLETLEREL